MEYIVIYQSGIASCFEVYGKGHEQWVIFREICPPRCLPSFLSRVSALGEGLRPGSWSRQYLQPLSCQFIETDGFNSNQSLKLRIYATLWVVIRARLCGEKCSMWNCAMHVLSDNCQTRQNSENSVNFLMSQIQKSLIPYMYIYTFICICIYIYSK